MLLRKRAIGPIEMPLQLPNQNSATSANHFPVLDVFKTNINLKTLYFPEKMKNLGLPSGLNLAA
jgi:hypothetical protein